MFQLLHINLACIYMSNCSYVARIYIAQVQDTMISYVNEIYLFTASIHLSHRLPGNFKGYLLHKSNLTFSVQYDLVLEL